MRSTYSLFFALIACFFAPFLFAPPPRAFGTQKEEIEREPLAGVKVDKERNATLIRVPVPLSAEMETRIINSIESISSRSLNPEENDRPIVILDFEAGNRQSERERVGNPQDGSSIGQGTSFERALSIARWLSGPKGNQIKSIGFVSQNLRGHAVLIALACEELVVLPDVELGLAGLDEAQIEPTIENAYIDVAKRRGMFPEAAIRSMLDPSQSLVKLDLENGGTEYKTALDLKTKDRPEGTWRETQLVPANQMASFTGRKLREWRWISHTVNEREGLAAELKLNGSVREQMSFPMPRHPVYLRLHGVLHPRTITRTIRAIDDAINNEKADLILIDLDSPGGTLEDSKRLAYHLAKIPADKAEVVVFVGRHARGDASWIALAADSIYMAPDSVLGTGGEATITVQSIENQRAAILELAQLSGRFPGDFVGLACPDAPVHEFRSFDGRRTRTLDGWILDNPQKPNWTKGQGVNYANGIATDQAVAMGIAVDRAPELATVAQKFGVQELPMVKQTSKIEQAVEWLASQRWLSYVLFLVGVIALSAEFSSPGATLPGLVALVCFLLFFWMNLFQGTIEWLEILLILGGIVCLLAEIFILPGFGIFGVAGLMMLGIGLLLAGQTFTIPTNRYQWEQVVQGLGQMGFGILSLFGAAVLFRKQLAALPMVRWFAFEQPVQDKFVVAMERLHEDMQALKGRFGTTTTRCNPHGRAFLGDQVVDVVAKSGWIDEDMPIEVLDVKENQVIIQRRRI